MEKCQKLTYEQRWQISVINRSGMSQKSIANINGISQPTISLELARNSGQRGYRHKQTPEKAKQRRQSAIKPSKRLLPLVALNVSKLKLACSPEQIADWFLLARYKH
jgi:IS30 family transposase